MSGMESVITALYLDFTARDIPNFGLYFFAITLLSRFECLLRNTRRKYQI